MIIVSNIYFSHDHASTKIKFYFLRIQEKLVSSPEELKIWITNSIKHGMDHSLTYHGIVHMMFQGYSQQ